jgi:hypothetical protein
VSTITWLFLAQLFYRVVSAARLKVRSQTILTTIPS